MIPFCLGLITLHSWLPLLGVTRMFSFKKCCLLRQVPKVTFARVGFPVVFSARAPCDIAPREVSAKQHLKI